MPKFDIQFTMNKESPSTAATVIKVRKEEDQTEELNFLAFAEIKEYGQLNIDLLGRGIAFLLKKPRDPRIPIWQIDVASGTGRVVQDTIKVLDDVATLTPLISIGVEPDSFAIQKAREKIPCTPHRVVQFIQGIGQELTKLIDGKIPSDGVDLASIHDALHEIREEEDKMLILKLIAQHLREGGIFTFNSAFTTVGMGKDGMTWGRWKYTAINLLGCKRDSGIPAIKIHTPGDYVKMITDAGLTVLDQGSKRIILTREALEHISRYPSFIQGVFEDMKDSTNWTLKQKSDALLQALEQLRITEIPRIWYEIIAQKTSPRNTSLA